MKTKLVGLLNIIWVLSVLSLSVYGALYANLDTFGVAWSVALFLLTLWYAIKELKNSFMLLLQSKLTDEGSDSAVMTVDYIVDKDYFALNFVHPDESLSKEETKLAAKQAIIKVINRLEEIKEDIDKPEKDTENQDA